MFIKKLLVIIKLVIASLTYCEFITASLRLEILKVDGYGCAGHCLDLPYMTEVTFSHVRLWVVRGSDVSTRTAQRGGSTVS